MADERLMLRPAGPDDLDLTLDWANDAGTRAGSFSTEPIERSIHAAWFARALSGERPLFVAVCDGAAVGLVRFDPIVSVARSAEVGITVAPQWRGQGFAVRLLVAGFEQARELGLRALVARVRADNTASARAFERAGYEHEGECSVQGIAALRFVWRDDD